MKNQNNIHKLYFHKANVSELNDVQMNTVDGGTTVPCVAVSIASIKLGYDISKDFFDN